MSTSLLVPIDLAPAPYELATSKFIAALTDAETQAAALKVTDATSAQAAAMLQGRLTEAGKLLEAERVRLTAPFLAAQRKIAEVAKGPQNRIEAAKGTLKAALTAYDAECRRQAAEAERKRVAEIARLEAIARDEAKAKADAEAAELRKAAEMAAQAEAAGISLGENLDEDEPVAPPVKTATQKAIEVLQHAPVVAAPKPAGVTFRTTLVPVVTDINLLPEPFVEKTAKMRAIISTYCAGWVEGRAIPVVSGVRFDVKRDAVSSGRTW